MAGNLEIQVDGVPKAQASIRAVAGRPKERLKHLLNRAAIAGMLTMRTRVPHSPPTKSTGGMEAAMETDRAEYRPGGAGGGGTWVAAFGPVKTGATVDESGHSYITNVFQGTGLYGPRGTYIKAAPGNVMVIEDYKPRDLNFSKTNPIIGKPKGNEIFTRKVRGQRPQRDWYYAGIERAESVISSNLHRIFNMNDEMQDI